MLKQTIRKLVPDSLIDYLRSKLGVPSQEDSLLRLKKLGYMPASCLDIGAYSGQWTVAFKSIFPDCTMLIIEGQLEKETLLAS